MALIEMDIQHPEMDCDFYYFKPGGKWKYHGEGMFPDTRSTESMTHEEIRDWNKGTPGISYAGRDMMIVVIPRGNCKAKFAYPRFVKNTEVYR